MGTNYTSGYDEYYSFTVSETGFLTLSTAGAGVGADGDVEKNPVSSCQRHDLVNPDTTLRVQINIAIKTQATRGQDFSTLI